MPLKPVSLLAAAPLLLLAGCEELDLYFDDGITTETFSVRSDANGSAGVELFVPDNATSFMVTATTRSALLSVDTVYDGSDEVVLYWEDWYGADQSLTYAIYPESDDVVLNWPVRQADGPLVGGTWNLFLGSYEEVGDYYEVVGNANIDITTQIKVDDSLSQGTVDVLVVYAEGVGADADVVAATEAAVTRWDEVWQAFGLSISVTYEDAGNIDPSLAFPGTGDSLSTASGLSNNRDVVVVIGEDIDGSLDYYGVAGSVPGTLVQTSRAGVVVSWLANAGGDGTFSNADVRIYGETLAHEVGHYTGLFHPVETTFDMWDALGDTDNCTSQGSCEDELGTNNMFPYPICNMTSCEAQEDLTDSQVAVAQRYTGTL